MARVAEYSKGHGLYEVVLFGQDFETGQDTVTIRRYWQAGEDLVKNAYNGVANGNFTMTVEYFKENFRWVNA